MTVSTRQTNFSEVGQTTTPAQQAGRVTTPAHGFTTMPGLLLRIEGLAVAAAAVSLYGAGGHRWWVLAALALTPDLSALGYLFGNRVGAVCYNIAHTYALPLVLGLAGVFLSWPLATQLALIWFVHIGIDRLAGYGLKYGDSFKPTHMQAVNQLPNQSSNQVTRQPID